MERFPSCFALAQFLRGAIRGRKSGRLTSAITGDSSRRSGAGTSRDPLRTVFSRFQAIKGCPTGLRLAGEQPTPAPASLNFLRQPGSFSV
jgi:hypothetical protein